ncbi:MAG: hypothetical protein FJY67_10150 [Calditrichaeota bacterium]|nr:hypothetical protein [Calditrichota bacterium]
MSPRTNLSLAALALLAVFSLFAAPSEAWAQHPHLDVTLTVNWLGQDPSPYHIVAEIQLLDGNGDPVAGFFAWLTPNSSYTEWTHTFINIPEDVVAYRISWNTGDPLEWEWQDAPPLEGEIKWNEAEIERVAEVLAL